MYRISVYDDTNPDYEFVKTANFNGPYCEILLPSETLNSCDNEDMDDFVWEIGNRIVGYINEFTTFQAKNEKPKKKMFTYKHFNQDDFTEAIFVRGFDTIEGALSKDPESQNYSPSNDSDVLFKVQIDTD